MTPQKAAILGGGFTKVIFAGGTGSVPALVEGQLAGIPCERWSGADRYATSIAIAENSIAATAGGPNPLTYNELATADGLGYADALSGGAFAGKKLTVLLLVKDNSPLAEAYLADHAAEIAHGHFLGGTSSLTADLAIRLEAASR